jgi:hypothetical protein
LSATAALSGARCPGAIWRHRTLARAAILLLVPGTIAPAEGLPMVNPLGKEVEIPIGLVILFAKDVTVCLSNVVQAVQRFAERLERAAATAFVTLPAEAVDQFVTLDLPIDDAPPAASAGT